MSQRGSFVTEYIYCSDCLRVLRAVLVKNDKFLKGIEIESWMPGETLPIIAGKIGAPGPGGEVLAMELDIGPAIAASVCHSVRVAVIPDGAPAALFTLGPRGALVRFAAGKAG